MICYVPHCAHYTESHPCKMFRFPKDPIERAKWIKAVRRKDREPNDSSRVCSCHFREGEKKNGPSIFSWNKHEIFLVESPVKKQPRDDSSILHNTQEIESHILPDSVVCDYNSDTESCSVDVVCDYNSDTESFSVDVVCDYNSDTKSSPVNVVCDYNSNTKSTQTINSVQNEAELYLLRSEVKQLQMEMEKLKKRPFSFLSISENDHLVSYYTGINKRAFLIISELCSEIEFKYFYRWKPKELSLNDQLLMTLMKLKLNLDYVDLGVRFNTSLHTVGNVVLTLIHLLHEILFEKGMKNVTSQSENVSSLPNCFTNFGNCRVVLDCIEFQCKVPKRVDKQKETCSSHKRDDTLKGLIGIASNGTITYASKLYPGSVSDKAIVQQCGVLDISNAGDSILTDKGSSFDDILPVYVSINVSPFLYSSQFTPNEAEETQNVARSKIHVGRANRRLKLYRILHIIPSTLYKYSTKIYQLCVALTNFQNPLVNEAASSFESLNSDISQSDNDPLEMDT